MACGPLASPPPAAPFNPLMGPEDINPILATRFLETGSQRVAFLLAGKQALIKAPAVTVVSTYIDDSTGETVVETQQAPFHPWPYGLRGSYVTELTFDWAGSWRLDIAVADDGEVSGSATLDLAVAYESPTPGIGRRPPLSRTKTLADVAEISQLTTDYTPDEDLYRLSVAEAIQSPRPAVIVFASPAFCSSPTCGPQVDTVSELKEAYPGRADFVHVELYASPQEIQGDLAQAQFADAVAEWGFTALPGWFNESWVFILNREGVVEHRFEGYATRTELEAALRQTLAGGSAEG